MLNFHPAVLQDNVSSNGVNYTPQVEKCILKVGQKWPNFWKLFQITLFFSSFSKTIRNFVDFVWNSVDKWPESCCCDQV